MKMVQWVLAKPVVGKPASSNFSLIEFDPPSLSEGEVLVEVSYHTVAPGIRARIGADTYAARIEVREAIPGMGVGTVLESASNAFEPGDLVVGQLTWGTHAVVQASDIKPVSKLHLRGLPLHTALGAMGPSGLTAYIGMIDVLNVRPGETVVVSSAAGAVGCIAGQVAKLLGCRVIGIAGGLHKCLELIETYGFDDTLDYHASRALAADLQSKAPKGVDAYFDNVGGEITDAVIQNMKLFGRIAVCGQTSEYDLKEPRGWRQTTSIITRRLSVRGFILFDYEDRFDEALGKLGAWLASGMVLDRPNILVGTENAAEGFVSQFSESAPGKLLIQVETKLR